MAILFTSEGFFNLDEYGNSNLSFPTFNSFLPLLTFFLSLFAAAYGTTKFFIKGPIQFLPKDSAMNNCACTPFITLLLINTMFGVRTVCIESAFFSTYRFSNKTSSPYIIKGIDPIINPEYRLPVYLAPCILSFSVNSLRLFLTTKGLGKYLLQYPQFLIACAFTPFLFEGCNKNVPQSKYSIQIWKSGTIINAFFIGVLPQCVVLFTDYYKGVHSWEFWGNALWEKEIPVFEGNNSLFKFHFGASIFALTTGIISFILIINFFKSGYFCRNESMHCNFLNILCCPISKPCIYYTDPILDIQPALALNHVSNKDEKLTLNQERTPLAIIRQGSDNVTCLDNPNQLIERTSQQVFQNFKQAH